MSATGRAGVDRLVLNPTDFFETPRWCTRAIAPHLPRLRPFDPCAGRGAILDAFGGGDGLELVDDHASYSRARGHQVTTADALTSPWAMRAGQAPHLVVMNPPFSLAREFVERAIEIVAPSRGTVATLLRVNWLASQERAPFHRAHPSDLYILPKRPSFATSATCSKKCGWAKIFGNDPVSGKPIAEIPRACPTCGHKLKTSSSDSAEYGWFVWSAAGGNRWFLLDLPEAA